jgi:hypothetical protein
MAIVVPIISSFDNRGIQKALKDFKLLEGSGQRGAFALLNTNKAVNTAAKNFAKLGAVGAGLAGVIGGSLVKAAYESQKVMKQTDAIIKATGGAAGLTGEQVAKLSQKLSFQSGVDDELIQSSLNLLLTFKQVRNEVGAGNDVFNRAAQAALDLGNVFGSTDAAAKMLGKALSDPIKGVTALARAGVNFSQQQRDQIKTLVQSGKSLDAQKLILKEVESQVGGTAAATATGFDRMKVAIGNVQENLGNLLIPVVEKFADGIINNVLPVLDTFTTIVGEQGLGSGINFLVGSILNGVNSLGAFGKVIIGVTAGIVALNVATGVYKASMIALNIVTTLTDGSLKALITRLGQAKIAMMAAGGVTALLSLAAVLYGTYASQKAKAQQKTVDFTNALLAEGAAQSQAFLELTKNNPQFKIMVASLEEIGITMADVTEFTTKGTGKFKPYVDALKIIDSTSGTTMQKLDAYAKAIGIAATATTSAGGSMSFGLSEFANMAKIARGETTNTQVALGLLGKIGITTATNVNTVSKVVETAAQKFEKFNTALFGAANSNKSFTAAVKASKKAQSDLAEATQNVVTAQTKLNQIAAGYGANSTQASEARKELTQAERDAERAGYALETANFAVTDAELALQEAIANGNPTEIRQAQIDLAEAKLSVKDAQDAVTTSTNNVAAAQKTLNEIVNGATTESQTYKDALIELQKAQQEEVDAIDAVGDAKLRELEATKALAKANLLLKRTQGKLTSKQMKSALKAINELNVAAVVPQPTSVSTASSGGFDFSGIDLSGISIGGLATLASGGIVTKPTLALIGEGGESEAVIPLSQMGNMGGGDVYNITINSKIADQTLPDVLVAELRKFNRRSGAINIQVA